MQAIADTNGYIGICCIPWFLRGAGDIKVLLDYIGCVSKKFGFDHVAIGTDVVYNSSNTPNERKKPPRPG